jgi:hypothetical protein
LGIRSLADLILQLKEEEARKLGSVGLTHAPTIGAMYEGLSRELLSLALPEKSGLQLTSGFITDGLGNLSGQIDCMLVVGKGETIPYTGNHKWHIKDVVAVLEIKKSLHRADLTDAFAHLRTISDLEFNYAQSWLEQGKSIDISHAMSAFAKITGAVPPAAYGDASQMTVSEQQIYYTLVQEQLGAVRIVLGYSGFQTEKGFRRSLTKSIPAAGNGYGVGSFPHLIISGKYTLAKANGLPLSAPLHLGKWPFYFSSSTNPIYFIIEYIWSWLERKYHVAPPWGDDLEHPALNPLLLARAEERDGLVGWRYTYLESVPEREEGDDYTSWEPTSLTTEQFVAIERLCAGMPVRADDQELIAYLTARAVTIDDFMAGLIGTGLVARQGDELQLTTDQCQCAILPDGSFVAAENNSGRFDRWLSARLRER